MDNLDKNETNFRLALLAVREVELAMKKISGTVDANHQLMLENHRVALENHRIMLENQEQLSSQLGEAVNAINRLGTAMGDAFEGFNLHSRTQQSIIARLDQVEADVARLKSAS